MRLSLFSLLTMSFALMQINVCRALADTTRKETWVINGVPTVVTITRHDGPAPAAPVPVAQSVASGWSVPLPVPPLPSPSIFQPVPSSCPNGKCPYNR